MRDWNERNCPVCVRVEGLIGLHRVSGNLALREASVVQ